MHVLVLSPIIREHIRQIVKYAEEHYVTEEQARATLKTGIAVGEDPNRRIEIDFGYRCVFSIEWQPSGRARHISISQKDAPPEKPLPSVEAVQMIMQEFGFKGKLTEGAGVIAFGEPMGDHAVKTANKMAVWTEGIVGSHRRAVNVVEIM